jgi:hypothetical protein
MAKSKAGSTRWAPVIVIIIIGALLLLVKQCQSNQDVETTNKKTTKTTSPTSKESKGLNRNPAAINYSKHARCRMSCRHISESEVKDILKNGKINYSKSEIGDNPDCKKKYAVEGTTKDGQKVRIIFAPCQSEVTVVTVIDLGRDWECDCP